MFGDDRLKISSHLKSNSYRSKFFDPWSFFKLFSNLSQSWTPILDIINYTFFWTTFPKSITLLIDFFPLQLYFSILFDFFFRKSLLLTFSHFFYPTFKSFLPHPKPFSFELSTLLTLMRSNIIGSPYITLMGKTGVKTFTRGVKN
eukprot:UN24421